jgi:hypothetical protein
MVSTPKQLGQSEMASVDHTELNSVDPTEARETGATIVGDSLRKTVFFVLDRILVRRRG